jgi:transcriptional regulator with XRE-family HTH domain
VHRNRETTLSKFEQTLRTGIARKLGRQVSAQRFADQFNLRAHGTETISRETARKWMRGTTIPDYERLAVLIQWLELDPLEFLASENTKQNRTLLNEVNIFAHDKSKRLEDLVAIVKTLDQQSTEALFITAWALRQVSKSAGAEKQTKKQ